MYFSVSALCPCFSDFYIIAENFNPEAYREMQNVYANCMVKSKAAESGCLHVNKEEKLRVNDHKTFASFFILYQGCKLIKI